jgi:hypothetical protein
MAADKEPTAAMNLLPPSCLLTGSSISFLNIDVYLPKISGITSPKTVILIGIDNRL